MYRVETKRVSYAKVPVENISYGYRVENISYGTTEVKVQQKQRLAVSRSPEPYSEVHQIYLLIKKLRSFKSRQDRWVTLHIPLPPKRSVTFVLLYALLL